MAGRGKGREMIVSVRLSPGEEAEIKHAAETRGEPVSAFLRGAALSAARPDHGRRSGPSWSTSPRTVAAGGTVIPRYLGTVESSQPKADAETAGTAAEPIARAR